MAKFFTAEVDKNWFLEMFEKYTGQRIKSTNTTGYRNQVLEIILVDADANERFSTRNTGCYAGFYQLALDLDTGCLDWCKLPEASSWGVKGLYESEHPGIKVMEVRPAWGGGWTLSCREEKEDK